MQQWFFVGGGPDRVVAFLYPSKWLHVVIIVYSIALLWYCLRAVRRPATASLAPLLPHLATAPILVAVSFSFIALIGDISGAPAAGSAPYLGLGVVWPPGLSRVLHLVPTGLASYLILLPLALWASHVHRQAQVRSIGGAA